MDITGIHSYTPASFGSKPRGDKSKVEEQARIVEKWVDHPLFQWGDNEALRERTFGLRAGPGFDVSNLVHEIAHCIQLEESRHSDAHDSGWGLRLRTVYIPGYDPIQEPLTTQCSEREAEVFAIQWIIMAHLFETTLEEYIAQVQPLFTYLPDYPLIPRGDDGHSWADDPIRHAWVRDRILHHIGQWSDIDKVRARLHQNLESIFGV